MKDWMVHVQREPDDPRSTRAIFSPEHARHDSWLGNTCSPQSMHRLPIRVGLELGQLNKPSCSGLESGMIILNTYALSAEAAEENFHKGSL